MRKDTVVTMPVTKLREELMHLPEILDKTERVTVTSRGHPVATIVSYSYFTELCDAFDQKCNELEAMYQEMQAMQETIEILQDAELMESIREGMKALQSGDTVSLEQARRALGME